MNYQRVPVLEPMEVFKPCLRCGYCCKQSACGFGDYDVDAEQCRYLVGTQPGEYRCGEYESISKQSSAVENPGFGTGCCSSMNSDRRELAESRRVGAIKRKCSEALKGERDVSL